MSEPAPAVSPSPARNARMSRVLLTVVAVAALFAAIGLLAIRPTGASQSQIGKPAPAFTLRPIGGGAPVRLQELRGQVVVLNFWASWCAPCRSEAPTLAAAFERWHLAPVAFLGITYQDEPSAAQAFARHEGISYPLVSDPGASVAAEYGVSGVPETIVVSPSGNVLDHAYGEVTGQELDSWVRSALGNLSSASSVPSGAS
jgi:cytochrome c biogenesis protein CcmG, thiol:disulfide interchange protein DsbE